MPPLSPAAQSLWTDANATGWGVDNGRSYIERIRALPDPDERVRLCRMFMDRQHASFRALELVVYETWRDGLAPDERPVAHSDDFGRLVDRGEEFRTSLAEILDGAGSDVDQAELLTVWVADGARWLGQLRSTRDTAIMNALASGLSPRDVARRLRMSKTQIINIRHRYLRDIEAVGAGTDDIVYRARDGIVVYLNDALRRYTGLDPADVIGRPTTELSHPDDYARFAPIRDEAVCRGFGRFCGPVRLRTAAGGWRWFDVDFRVLRDPDTGRVEVHAGARPCRSEPAAVHGPQAVG